MRIDVISYRPHTSSFEAFQLFSQQHLDLYSCEIEIK